MPRGVIKGSKVILQYLDFQNLFGGGTILCFITSNVVLFKETGGVESYSVFYGQTFSANPRGRGEEKYCLAGPFLLRGSTDVARLPLHPSEEETVEAFEARKINVGTASGTSVHSVVNLVVVLRKFLPKTKLLEIERSRAGSRADRRRGRRRYERR